MKNFKTWIILSLTLLLCFCVFPFCLVRKDANVDPDFWSPFGQTAESGQQMTQTFLAQTCYLSEIAFDIAFPNGKPETGNLLFCLREENESSKVILEKSIPITDIQNNAFTYVEINKWIKKGKLYSYSITSEDKSAIQFSSIYTIDEGCTPGNQTLYFDGNQIEGQAVTRYVYSFPLNYKNVLCLWSFILAIGFIVLEFSKPDSKFLLTPPHKNKCSIDSLLKSYQIPILLLEITFIIIMLIRLCQNEAVHWDEAYTWKMVTTNNFSEMLRVTANDVHPPLYYILVMIAINIFGKSIFTVKMVSVIGTLATCLLGLTLIRKRWGVKVSIPFILVTGLGTQFVYYSVDVRMYSWLCFFVMATALFAYEIIQTGKLKWWIGLTCSSLACIYTQYFAVVPLFLIYLYLFLWIITKEKKQLKKWLCCCVAVVIGYLPWITVVIDTLRRDANSVKQESAAHGIIELFEWSFENNIIFSQYMPVIIFVVSAIYLIIKHKEYSKKEQCFLFLSGSILFLSYALCMLLTSVMNHFWDFRYLFDTLLFVWLFIFIFISKRSTLTWFLSMIWLGISVLSSYTIMQATEFNTIPWVSHAKSVLDEIQDEEIIVYTFPTFDVLYEYYLPSAEFIWYEDVNFEEMNTTFYVMSWGANDFPKELYETNFLHKEIISNMRLEEGITCELWKIEINR